MENRGAAVPWYLAGGILPASVNVAYLPQGAANLAASYINLANPGTHDAVPGVAPTLDARGWVFNGITQYLRTGSVITHTAIIFYDYLGGNGAYIVLGGFAGTEGMYIWPNSSNRLELRNKNVVVDLSPAETKEVDAIAGAKGFRNGYPSATLADNANTTQEIYIGAMNNGGSPVYNANAAVRAVALYNTVLTDAQVLAVCRAIPGSPVVAPVNFGLGGSSTNYADLGNVLDYEYTQAWSCGVTFRRNFVASKYADILFTNVTANAPYPGYEFFILGNVLCVRIINSTSAPHYIEVVGSTNVLDGQIHRAWATYDGSGTAAGVKIYLDGALETLVVNVNNLAGNSIVAAGQSWRIINQQAADWYLNGRIKDLVLDSVVRNATYVGLNSNPSVAPNPDAGNRQLLLLFNERTGTVAADTSGNGYNATLSSASMWL